MKNKCEVCKEKKESVKPRTIVYENVKEPRFVNPILTSKWLPMCDDCFKDYKEEKISIKFE